MVNKTLFESERTEFPLCFMGFHLYDDFFTQVYSNSGQLLKRYLIVLKYKFSNLILSLNIFNIILILRSEYNCYDYVTYTLLIVKKFSMM